MNCHLCNRNETGTVDKTTPKSYSNQQATC